MTSAGTPSNPDQVPKKIHFIWVGMPIPDEFIENIKAWQKVNPDYEVHLWMDTGATKPDDIEKAKSKAKIPGVKVHNLAEDEKGFYAKMKTREIYNDELTGKDANYAAASDLLRTEILYEYGGLYIDTDLPPKDPLGDILAPQGFVKSTNFSNDFLCATPKAAFVDALRNKMLSNYNKAMSENPDMQFHRSKRSWMERTETTLIWTGPYLYNDVFREEREKLKTDDEQLKFFEETQSKELENKFIEESSQTWRDKGPQNNKEQNIYFKEELNYRLRHTMSNEINNIAKHLTGKNQVAYMDLANKLASIPEGIPISSIINSWKKDNPKVSISKLNQFIKDINLIEKIIKHEFTDSQIAELKKELFPNYKYVTNLTDGSSSLNKNLVTGFSKAMSLVKAKLSVDDLRKYQIEASKSDTRAQPIGTLHKPLTQAGGKLRTSVSAGKENKAQPEDPALTQPLTNPKTVPKA